MTKIRIQIRTQDMISKRKTAANTKMAAKTMMKMMSNKGNAQDWTTQAVSRLTVDSSFPTLS